MTTDKIRNEIGEILWNFWQNQHDIKQIKKAEETLRGELDDKILTDEKYFANINLFVTNLASRTSLHLSLKGGYVPPHKPKHKNYEQRKIYSRIL